MLQSAGERASLTRLVVGRLVRLGPPQPEWLIPSPGGSSSSSRLTWASSHGGLNVPQNREQVSMFSYFLSVIVSHWPKQLTHPSPESVWEGRKGNYYGPLCKQLPQYPITGYRFLGENLPENAVREVPFFGPGPQIHKHSDTLNLFTVPSEQRPGKIVPSCITTLHAVWHLEILSHFKVAS